MSALECLLRANSRQSEDNRYAAKRTTFSLTIKRAAVPDINGDSRDTVPREILHFFSRRMKVGRLMAGAATLLPDNCELLEAFMNQDMTVVINLLAVCQNISKLADVSALIVPKDLLAA